MTSARLERNMIRKDPGPLRYRKGLHWGVEDGDEDDGKRLG